jgi:hypothetical protein
LRRGVDWALVLGLVAKAVVIGVGLDVGVDRDLRVVAGDRRARLAICEWSREMLDSPPDSGTLAVEPDNVAGGLRQADVVALLDRDPGGELVNASEVGSNALELETAVKVSIPADRITRRRISAGSAPCVKPRARQRVITPLIGEVAIALPGRPI